MASTTAAKAPNGSPRTTAPPSANGSDTTWTQQDTRLLKFVRSNIQPIVTGMLRMAAHSGEERDYAAMGEFQNLAGQLSQLGGLAAATSAAAPAAAMTATAGAH